MILTAHQPAYLPWLGLFHKIAISDIYVFLDNVKYSKSERFTNRNTIKKPGGGHVLTIPINTGGSDNINIFNLKINYQSNWRQKHFTTIKQLYSKSSFGNKYIDILQGFYEKKYIYLKDLNYDMMLYFLDILNINIKVFKASELEISSKKNLYLIDLCNYFSCDTYIFGGLGGKYVDKKQWNEHGLYYYIQDYEHPIYNQQYGEFVPYLSIIDLLCNHGDEAKEILMGENIKKQGVERKVKTSNL